MVKLSEDNSHNSYMLTPQAKWCFTSTILLFLQNKYHRHSHDDIQQWNTWQHPVFLSISRVQHTDTCHVTPHAPAAQALLSTHINQYLDSDHSL